MSRPTGSSTHARDRVGEDPWGILDHLSLPAQSLKRAGVEWAKATLDPSWADLIDRTWAGRPNPALSVRQPADLADFSATLQFLRYIMNESAIFAQSHPSEVTS